MVRVFRCDKIFRIALSSVMNAMTRKVPPQSHCNGSTRYTRRMGAPSFF